VEVLSTICRRDSDCRGRDECYDCSLVPALITSLIDGKRDSGEDPSSLERARLTLDLLCKPCLEPLFDSVIRMDEPGAPKAFDPAKSYDAACESKDCSDSLSQLASAFHSSTAGQTTEALTRMQAACVRPDKAAVAHGLYDLLRTVGPDPAAPGLRAVAAAARVSGGRARQEELVTAPILALAAAAAVAAVAVAVVGISRHAATRRSGAARTGLL